jgi:hypothetical protein
MENRIACDPDMQAVSDLCPVVLSLGTIAMPQCFPIRRDQCPFNPRLPLHKTRYNLGNVSASFPPLSLSLS